MLQEVESLVTSPLYCLNEWSQIFPSWNFLPWNFLTGKLLSWDFVSCITQPTPTVPLPRSALVWHLQGTYLRVVTKGTASVQLAYLRSMQLNVPFTSCSQSIDDQLLRFLKLTRDYRERKAEERRFKIEKQPVSSYHHRGPHLFLIISREGLAFKPQLFKRISSMSLSLSEHLDFR